MARSGVTAKGKLVCVELNTKEDLRQLVAGAGLDPENEWLLMFLSGIKPSRIAAVCGADPNAVHNQLRRFTRAVPVLPAIHRANVPATAPGGSGPVSKQWVSRLEEVLAYRSEYGHFPHTHLDVPEHAKLGRWLEAQRRQLREGTLSQPKITLLEQMRGWKSGYRKQVEEERSRLRIRQLKEFSQETNRLPSYRSSDLKERSIGIWLHARRIQANKGVLDPELSELLTAVVPDWRGRRHSKAYTVPSRAIGLPQHSRDA